MRSAQDARMSFSASSGSGNGIKVGVGVGIRDVVDEEMKKEVEEEESKSVVTVEMDDRKPDDKVASMMTKGLARLWRLNQSTKSLQAPS